MNNGKLDTLLYLAAPYVGQKELDIYNNATGSFTPSKKYQRRMSRMLKSIERQEKWAEWQSITTLIKRVAVAIMVVCTVSLGCILSISAVREAIWQTIVSWYEKHIEVQFVTEDEVVAPTEILVYKEPTMGLDGYDRFEIGKNPDRYCIEYEADTGFVRYEQSILGMFPVLLTNTDSTLYDITISGNSGVYIEYTLQGTEYIGLTWNDGEYQYTLEGTVSLDELITIAENIK